jgi:thiol-disulfide isomerase/thioredoxin
MTNHYREKGVAVVAINPNDAQALRVDELGYTDVSDSLDEMKLRAAERKFPFPYLDDGATQKVAHTYGVLATPHVFIFDSQRKLRYQGRVDDSDVREVKSHDARNAIEALLAGKAPPVETTRVFGCSTKWAEKREDARKSIEKWDQEPVKLESIDIAGVKVLAKNDGEKAPLRLISAWATWCGPCVEELPELVTIQRMYRRRGFEVVTLSMDEPDASKQALKVLTENHCSGTNYHFTGEDRDALMKALDEKWAGPIPHTILVAPGGKVLYRATGPIDALKLKRAIVDFLGRTYASRPVAQKNAR